MAIATSTSYETITINFQLLLLLNFPTEFSLSKPQSPFIESCAFWDRLIQTMVQESEVCTFPISAAE